MTQPYIDGSPFTLITDHSALQWLFDFTGNNRRLLRWSMELQPYRGLMAIQHRAGRLHSNVDCRSQALLPTTNTTTQTTGLGDKAFAEIIEDLKSEQPRPMNAWFTLDSDSLLFYLDPSTTIERLCVPHGPSLQLDLMHDAHDAISAGHLGKTKTLSMIT